MNSTHNDTPGTKANSSRSHYWDRFQAQDAQGEGRIPDGGHLAALRRGAGREPGSVPELWPYYRELPEQGYRITPRLRAEHHTLVLFGFHQQSQRQPVNVRGSSVGAAARRLQQRARYSEEAVERRFTSAATTNNVNELAVLLRGLITQMRGEHIGLDYQRLFYDLVSWQDPDHRDQARMRWGSDYFRFPRESTE